MTAERITGGCLCGAVRYAADGPPSDVSYCHCRMCQQHFGSPFGTYVYLPTDRFRFVKGAPRHHRSSGFARRGFCADCGSPLTFEYLQEPERLSVTIGSLDHPERVPPEQHWGIESQFAWLRIADGLPRHRTEEDPDFRRYAAGASAAQETVE